MNSIWISGVRLYILISRITIYLFDFFFIDIYASPFSCIWSCDYRRLYLCASFGMRHMVKVTWVNTIAWTSTDSFFVSSGIASSLSGPLNAYYHFKSYVSGLSSAVPCQENDVLSILDARYVLSISVVIHDCYYSILSFIHSINIINFSSYITLSSGKFGCIKLSGPDILRFACNIQALCLFLHVGPT